MLAGVLLFFILISIVASVWALTRVRSLSAEVVLLEQLVTDVGELVRNVARVDVPEVELPVVQDATVKAASDVLVNASEDDVAAARELLRKMGIG